MDAAGNSQVWMCSPRVRVGLNKDLQAQQNPLFHKWKRGKHKIHATTPNSFEMKITVAASTAGNTQSLNTHMHTHSNSFDKERQQGSMTDRPGEAVFLRKVKTNDKRWQHLIAGMWLSWDRRRLWHTDAVKLHKYIHSVLKHAVISNLPPGPLANEYTVWRWHAFT